jgi:enolase
MASMLRGSDGEDQALIDARIRELDGTPGLVRLGANAAIGVSMAVARAVAVSRRQPLYQRIAELASVPQPMLPLPMVNILSGGLHAGGAMDFQDFLIIPMRAESMEQAIHLIARVREAATEVCRSRGLSTLLADEGGLSPGCKSSREALLMTVEVIEQSGLKPGEDVAIAIDAAASRLRDGNGRYRLEREGLSYSSEEMVDLFVQLVSEFPIASIEDALEEEDWSGWRLLTNKLGAKVQLVGDDLFTTNPLRLERGVREIVANGVLVKANQNGTLTGTLDVIARAKSAGYATIVSARSGETEDTFMSDLAVGTAAGQIKIGSLRTSNTVAKYNQLLRIEEASHAQLANFKSLAHLK